MQPADAPEPARVLTVFDAAAIELGENLLRGGIGSLHARKRSAASWLSSKLDLRALLSTLRR